MSTRQLVEDALNLEDTGRLHTLKWERRLERIANKAKMSIATARRRVDDAIRDLAHVLLSERTLPDDPFTISFGEFPERVVADGLARVHVVVGTTQRERLDDGDVFDAPELSATILGERVDVRRQTVPGTVRDLVRVTDVCAMFAETAPDARGIDRSPRELCVADIALDEQMLQHHLVIVGGADTNAFVAITMIAIAKRFGALPAIHYSGDRTGYFTCDEIESTLSGARYLRLEESGGMHCGFALFGRNPWNPAQTVTIASGIRATGTQAALVALVLRSDELLRTGGVSEHWRQLSANNRFNPGIGAKIVRASRARVIRSTEPIAPSEIIAVPAQRRIPQRHAITDFIFEE